MVIFRDTFSISDGTWTDISYILDNSMLSSLWRYFQIILSLLKNHSTLIQNRRVGTIDNKNGSITKIQ